MKIKSLQALKKVRHKFVDQEAESRREEEARLRRIEQNLLRDRERHRAKQLEDAEREVDVASAETTKAITKLNDKKYSDHNDIRRRDLAVEELLSLALHHVTQLNSYDTAKRILSRANALLPSEVNVRRFADATNKNPIRRAFIALNNLVKVSKKKRYRIGGKYDGTNAKQHWLNVFHEAIQDAFVEVRIDIQKREGSFFSSINSVMSDLPTMISNDKKYIRKTAQVVVNVRGSLKGIYPSAKPKLIEAKLVLLNKANLIGIKTTPGLRATKGQLKEANEIAAKKYEATVYHAPIPRPSQNIMWFLVLDFGVGIDAAMFPEHMSTSGLQEAQSPIVASNLSDFIRKFNDAQDQRQRVNMEINRTLRLEFEAAHRETYDIVKTNNIVLDALVTKKKELEEEFASLTSFDGDAQNGLSIRSYNTKFDDFFMQFMRRQISSSVNMRDTRLGVIEQRKDARYVYWLHRQVLLEASKIRSRLAAINAQLQEEKLRILKAA